MSQYTASSEILVLKFLKRAYLHHRVVMGLLHYVKLVLVCESEHDQVTGSESCDHDVSAFASHGHGVERHVCFNCVVAGLERLVPDLERLLDAASEELLIVQVPDAGD